MSLATWKKEFYTKEPSVNMTKKQAIMHSLKKWRGLTKANLKKHNIFQYGFNSIGTLAGLIGFQVDGSSCALCEKYIGTEDEDKPEMKSCVKCPLAQSLGHPCDGHGRNRPYSLWVETGRAQPMIKALEKLLE